MRKWLAGSALLGGVLLLAGEARAQSTMTFGGVNPSQIRNVPITIPDVARPIAQPQQLERRTFNLARYLPKITLPSANGVFGRSVFPSQEGMPGKKYLEAFRFERPRPVQ
jgi:hypothetical protein